MTIEALMVEQREFHAFSLLGRLCSVMGPHAIMPWNTLQSHRLQQGLVPCARQA